jgi:hypothetical protein
MIAFHSTINAHPVSPIPSPHSIPTKVALRGPNSTSVANATFPFSLQFCNFFNLQKSGLLTFIRPELARHSSSVVQKSHHSSNIIPCCL